jgi:hypothetical protein
MPRYIRAALGVDRDWVVHGYCRHADGGRDVAWRCSPAERITIGKTKYIGAELIAYAEATCELCPVQWECARYALKTEANHGTWGAAQESLEWLRKHCSDPAGLIDVADHEDITVAEAILIARQATC